MPRRHALSRTLSWPLIVATAAVCAASLEAQENAATALVLTGQVSILKDGYPQPLFQGNPVRPQQIIITGPDSYAKFQIPDGSTFEVFANSRVTFRDNYPGWTDLLNVVIGRVKVFIEHSRGPNPKNVTTPTAVISVRGTVFDVVVEDDDGTTFVTVDEGLVAVRNTTAPGGEPLLKPGDSIRIFRNQPLIPQQIDHAALMRGILRAAEQAMYRVIYQRPGGMGPIGGAGAPGAGTAGGQGDRTGKNGGNTGTGTTNGAPAPPSPPPPASGGH
jgi:ferric-dicitrate binding protein FerR (iron transport regulator)